MTKKELKVKKLLLMPKNLKISSKAEPIRLTPNFHMHQPLFKLMLKLKLDTGVKKFQFQDL